MLVVERDTVERRRYKKRALPVPTSLDEVQDHLLYGMAGVRALFGTSDRQIQRWIDAGELRRLDNTGVAKRFSGAHLREFAERVLGAKSTQDMTEEEAA